jgi:uncharacterized protein (DUF58 family)
VTGGFVLYRIFKLRLPVSIQFTREGLIFVLLSLAIGAAAVNTGNNVLYLIFSLMLGMIIVSGVVSRRMLVGLDAKLDFPQHLFSGVRNVCYITLSNNKKRVPSVAIRMVINDASFVPISRYFFYVSPQAKVSGFASVLFPKRGIYRLSEMQLQTRAPFSFFIKIRKVLMDRDIKIYPQIFRMSDEVVAKVSEGFIADSPYIGDSHHLLHLRDYVPFDSSRRIHWKASAKIERLLVKEFQKEQGRDIHLYYDCYAADSLTERQQAERAISLIASLAYFLSDRGVATQVVFGDRSFHVGVRSVSLIPLLDFMVVFDPTQRPATASLMPANTHTAVLFVRSRKISPIVSVPWPHSRTMYVEDWIATADQVVNEVA